MTARPITSLYTVLIDRAVAVTTRGPLNRDDELAEIYEAIDAEVSAISETRLIFDEERLLAFCLQRIEFARRVGDVVRAMLWTQVAGVLLPHVREHLSAALLALRDARAATTDQDYAKPR